MNIQKTNDMKVSKLNMLVYGPPGAGKTRFAGTCKPLFNPLILSAESGLLSLKNLTDDKGHPYNFDFVAIDKFEAIEEARQYLRFQKHSYDTVILDSITEIQQACMDKILRDEKLEKARIQDWGTLAQRMITVIRDFRDMNLNLIVTALTDSTTDEETNTTRFLPMVQGKLKETLAGYFDEVFYLLSKEVKAADGKTEVQRRLITQGTQKVTAKDRSGKLARMVEPDFCAIYETIYGKPKQGEAK